PDGKSFVSVNDRDSIRIHKISNGQVLRQFYSKEGYEQVVFSPDGKQLLLRKRAVIEVLDIHTGEYIFKIGKNYDGFNSGAFSKYNTLALAGHDKKIHIYNSSKYTLNKIIEGKVTQFDDSLKSNIKFWVKNLGTQKLSTDGRYVLQGKKEKSAILWDLKSGRVIQEYKGHESTVINVDISPDNKFIATASADRTAGIWDLESGQLIHRLEFHSGAVFSANFDLSGKFLTTTSWDGWCALWNVTTGKLVGRYKPHQNGSPITASLSPNGLYVISGGLDKRLVLSDMDTGQPVMDFIGHRNHVVSLDFSLDSTYMLTGSWDGLAKLWNLSTGLQVARYDGHKGMVNDVTISSDNQYVVTGGSDKKAILWERTSAKKIRSFIGHTGAITSVNLSPDNKFLITNSRDGSTKVWDLASGNELITHYLINTKDWIVRSPSGHFYATDGARKLVYFVRGTESFNIERFYDEFYDPGLLKKVFSGNERDLMQGNLDEHLIKFPPPKVEILSPTPPYASGQTSIELMIRFTNSGGGLREIKVTQNGKRIINDYTDLEKVKDKKSIIKIYTIHLVPGSNELAISAINHGKIESEIKQLQFTVEGDEPVSDCYILSIGINQYTNPALNLNYAQSDATGFAEEIRKSTKKLFKKIYIKTLLNHEATKENILKALNEIIESAKPNDVFYFFYAGHGSIDNNTFFFIPTEITRLYDTNSLQEGALSASEMQEYFMKIKALKQVMLIDACHSGGSTELLAMRGASEEKALSQLSRSTGIHVLAAAGSEQTAAEFTELGHGLFTYMLLQGISGKADGAPLDNKITIYELKSFLDDQVPEYSRKHKGSAQYPSTFSRGQDFPVTIKQ
ncbi:MAG: caspase family protein, partial [Cyclobacteriaceae bacterium]|nr:caspase family protein [Cyclobacteriaceae bacterium]